MNKARKSLLALGIALLTANTAQAVYPQGRFLIFQSRGELIQWQISRFEKMGIPSPPILAAADARYDRIQSQISIAWKGFQALYPNLVAADVPPPQLMIYDVPEADGHAAGYDLQEKLTPLYFVASTGLLSFDVSEDESLGFVIHELAHLVFQHSTPGEKEKIEKCYRVTNSLEPLGETQIADSVVTQYVREWTRLSGLMGPYALPELKGLPVGWLRTGYLSSTLSNELSSAAQKETTPGLCKEAQDAYARFLEQYNAIVSPRDYSLLAPSTAERMQLAQSVQSTQEKIRACLNGPTPDLTTWWPVEGDFAASDRQIFAAQPTLAQAIEALTQAKQSEMSQLESSYTVSSLRCYTVEEQADDVSVRILYHMGRQDPAAIGEMILKAMLSKDEQKACRELIQSGAVPHYGILADDHHSPCYRLYHARAFLSFLKSSSVGRYNR